MPGYFERRSNGFYAVLEAPPSLRNMQPATQPRPAPPIACYSTRATRRKTRRASNLYAYDYDNRFVIRVWGANFKPSCAWSA